MAERTYAQTEAELLEAARLGNSITLSPNEARAAACAMAIVREDESPATANHPSTGILREALETITQGYRAIQIAQGMTSEEVDSLPAVQAALSALASPLNRLSPDREGVINAIHRHITLERRGETLVLVDAGVEAAADAILTLIGGEA